MRTSPSRRLKIRIGCGLLLIVGGLFIIRNSSATAQDPGEASNVSAVESDTGDTPVDTAAVQFRLLEPRSLASGAAVRTLRIEAINRNGQRESTFSGDITIEGLLRRKEQIDHQQPYEPFQLTRSFSEGRLQITADDADGQHLSIAADGLRLSSENQLMGQLNVPRYSPWLRILPPVMAILLAVMIGDVNVSLLLAAFAGCLLYFNISGVAAATDMLCSTLQRQIADPDRASVILFTMFLGAMIGLMNDSGGTQAVVIRMARFARTRERGQLLTWLMGLIVFFDDYANTMLIGGAMRPLSDRLRISRQKLAFLIDSTAAPVAGLAVVSTWVAFEIDQIAAGLAAAGIEGNPAGIFYQTIPYRIYPILTLVLVGVIAYTGKDFGAMLRAERKALSNPQTVSEQEGEIACGSIWYAILPVLCLTGLVVICYLNDVDSYRLLLIASLVSSVLAFVLPWVGRRMSLEECSKSWTNGVGSMVSAVVVLTLAWTVSDVCRPDQLDTAGFIISQVGNSLQAEFMPCIAFLVSGAIALSIGSSFTTMALLMPLFIPLCVSLLPAGETATDPAQHALFLGTVGAILAGAIFGDHCSPISDTTVLSSAAAGCDHLEHVSTQLPYAMMTGAFSILAGYLPMGFGLPWWLALPMGLILTTGAIIVFGQRPYSDTMTVDSSASPEPKSQDTLP